MNATSPCALMASIVRPSTPGAPRDRHSVEHQHQQIEIVEPAGELLAQLVGHPRDQMAARRALAGSARQHARRPRLKASFIAAGRDPKQDLIEHSRRHRIDALEVLDRSQPRLLPRSAPHAWTPDHDPPPAQRQLGAGRTPAIVSTLP